MENMTVTFGQYKGMTLEQIASEDRDYLWWLAGNAYSPAMRRAAAQVAGSAPRTLAEQIEDADDARFEAEYAAELAPLKARYFARIAELAQRHPRPEQLQATAARELDKALNSPDHYYSDDEKIDDLLARIEKGMRLQGLI